MNFGLGEPELPSHRRSEVGCAVTRLLLGEPIRVIFGVTMLKRRKEVEGNPPTPRVLEPPSQKPRSFSENHGSALI